MCHKLVLLFLVCGVIEIWACNSCAISSGGPIVQALSKKYIFIDGLYWNWRLAHKTLLFVDKYNNSINHYHIESGKIDTVKIDEFKNKEVAAIFPIKQKDTDEHNGKLKYVIATNQSLYKFEGKLHEPYTIEKIMDIADESQYFTKAAIDKNGHIVIGTKPTDFKNKLNYTKITEGTAKYYYVNVANKSKKLIDDGQDISSGVCFNKYYDKMYTVDDYQSKIFSFTYNVTNGDTSNKTEIFDLAEYNKTMDYSLRGNLVSVILDSEDNLWIGSVYSFEILVFNQYQRKITKRIGVPSKSQISLMWGGDFFDILFVGTENKPEADSGSLLAISNTGHRGWPSYQIVI